ncbi:hypothetical protein ABFS83_12G056500 [Erythranthe nasuta]
MASAFGNREKHDVMVCRSNCCILWTMVSKIMDGNSFGPINNGFSNKTVRVIRSGHHLYVGQSLSNASLDHLNSPDRKKSAILGYDCEKKIKIMNKRTNDLSHVY